MIDDLLLDSGAYSSFTRGLEINLQDYIAFLREHRNFTQYISLDHIPGENGRRRHDPRAAELTYRNHQQMKAADLRPIPVFHRQDDLRWLERYLADGEQRIALAPLPMQQTEVIEWFKRCFAMLPSTTRVHALGTAVASILRDFPFDSADSTRWINVAANGNVLVPVFDDYRHRPHIISVSDRSSWRRNDFASLDPLRKQQAAAFFAECETSLHELRVSKAARLAVCLRYLQALAAVSNTRIYFVSTVRDPEVAEALRQCGVRSHLLSYAELKDDVVGMIKYVWGKWW